MDTPPFPFILKYQLTDTKEKNVKIFD